MYMKKIVSFIGRWIWGGTSVYEN